MHACLSGAKSRIELPGWRNRPREGGRRGGKGGGGEQCSGAAASAGRRRGKGTRDGGGDFLSVYGPFPYLSPGGDEMDQRPLGREMQFLMPTSADEREREREKDIRHANLEVQSEGVQAAPPLRAIANVREAAGVRTRLPIRGPASRGPERRASPHLRVTGGHLRHSQMSSGNDECVCAAPLDGKAPAWTCYA